MSLTKQQALMSVNQVPPLTIAWRDGTTLDSSDFMPVSWLYGGISIPEAGYGFTDTVAFDLYIHDVHVGNVGTLFSYSVTNSGTTTDLSSANTTTSRVLLFKKPDGTVATVTASFVDSGTSGVLYWQGTSGFFDTPGMWRAQARLGFSSSTNTFYTDIDEFRVWKNLE